MKMKNRMQRLSALLLVLVMCFALLPVSAFADEDQEHAVYFGVHAGVGRIAISNCLADWDDENDGRLYTTETREYVAEVKNVGDGYKFVKWVDKNGNTISTDAEYRFTVEQGTDYYIYAIFEQTGEPVNLTFTVQTIADSVVGMGGTFSCDGGATYVKEYKKDNLEAGVNYTLTAKADEGYKFLGWVDDWNDSDFLSTAASYTTGSISKTTKIWAVFEKVSEESETPDEPEVKPVNFTVTFNTDGGSAVADQTVESGSKATKPSDPKKSGYTFKGWYANKDCTTAFDFSTAIEKDTTVYAKWVKASSTDTKDSSPKTGGNSSTVLWAVLMSGSLLGFAAVAVCGNRRKTER